MAKAAQPAPVPAHVLINRLDLLRVRHLKLLELVASSGSLTAAAEVLRVSQPSATKMLQELERALGCTLVDRTTRGGTLSAMGQRALERLRIATGALSAVGQAMASQADVPLVRIGMLPLAGVALIPRMVAILSASGTLPRLQLLDGSVSHVLAMLRRGEIDCVIGRVDTEDARRRADELEIVPLSDERFEVACGCANRLARARNLGRPRLREHSWILPNRDTYTRRTFDAAFVSQGLLPPPPQIESQSFHTSLATVAESRLLTFAPKSAVDYYVALGKVRKVHLAQPFQADYAVFITLKGNTPLPAVDLIRTVLQQLTQE